MGGGRELSQGKMDNIFCWNVQGITNASKQKDVNMMLGTRPLGLVSLIEPKVKANKIGRMYQNLLVDGVFVPVVLYIPVVES